MRTGVRIFLQKTADLFFPRRCPVCGIVLKMNERVCIDCKGKIEYIVEPKCKKCGKPIRQVTQEYCSACEKGKHYYDKGIAMFTYNDAMRGSIYQYKYHNKREYADFYAEEICRYLGNEIVAWNADAIIPIPLHKQKLRKRGFNQAELLARKVGKKLDIPVRSDIVCRSRKTKAQKELGDRDRINNLKKAFKIIRNDVKLNTVILLDDIYTTGSTIDAVAKILRETGTSHIYYVALSIGDGR